MIQFTSLRGCFPALVLFVSSASVFAEENGVALKETSDPGLLRDRGLEVGGSLTGDLFRNFSGGLEPGWEGNGLLHLQVDLDLERALGWRGARFGMCLLGIAGEDLSETRAGNLLTVSNLAAREGVRLLDFWVEQDFLDGGLSVRAGQLVADSDFMVCTLSELFVNGTFGWPALAFLNQPEGGSGWPLASLGVRVAWEPAENLLVQAGVYEGHSRGEDGNRHGLHWNPGADSGWTCLAEVATGWTMGGLPGGLKIGGWLQTGDHADALDGGKKNNGGGYLIVEQALCTECQAGPAAEEGPPPRGVSAFARIGGAPANRSFCDFYADCGLVCQGPLPGRADDKLGLGFAYAHISDKGRQGMAADGFRGLSSEAALELTYQLQLTDRLFVQPDLQYIIRPGAVDGGLRVSLEF